MRHWMSWACAMVFIAAVLVRLPGLDRLLDGSEVDYVLAARRGFVTNYFDIGTRPVWEFVATGLAMAGLGGEESAEDPDLWRRDVEAGDIAAYRHYHPPLFIYLLHAAERLAGYSDVAVRLVPLAFALATIATAYLGCALLIPVRGAQIGLVAAAILAALPLHVATATDIGWHVPYACLATVSLFAMGYFVTRPTLHALVAAAVTATIAFMTLEHAIFLYIDAGGGARRDRQPLAPRVSIGRVLGHRGLLVAVTAALLTMLLAWPASLIKLSIVKNLGVHAYYSRVLDLSPRFYDVYLVLFDRYPVMTALAAVTAVLSIMRRSHLPRALLPFAIYALAVVVLQAGNQQPEAALLRVAAPAAGAAVSRLDCRRGFGDQPATPADRADARRRRRGTGADVHRPADAAIPQPIEPQRRADKPARTRRGPRTGERAHVARRQSRGADARLLSP